VMGGRDTYRTLPVTRDTTRDTTRAP
jgi:hypothetical protein